MSFTGIFLTDKGKALLAKVQTGTQLSFTKAQIGSGNLPEGKLITETTVLYDTNPLNIAIQKIAVSREQVTITTQISNSTFDAAFEFREIGIFAVDPTEGEILYLYGNAAENADVIPDKTSPEEFSYNVISKIDNSTNVNISVTNSILYATKEDITEVSEEISDHISDENNPHNITIAKIGAAASSHNHSATEITSGTLPIARGGTGATTAAAALTAIGAAASSHEHSATEITSGTLPIARGGTGATTASAALTAIGAAASSHNQSASTITSGTLPIARGGTGVTSSTALKQAILNGSELSAASTGMTSPGITVGYTSAGTSGNPESSAGYILLNVGTDTDRGAQFAFRNSSTPAVYVRIRQSSGTYTAWSKFV